MFVDVLSSVQIFFLFKEIENFVDMKSQEVLYISGHPT